MKKLKSLFIISALLAGPAALAQSGLLPPNTVQAGPPTGSSQGFVRARSIVATDITLPSGQLLVGQAGGLAAAKALSGDATLSATGAIVVTKTNGATLTTLATTTPGTGVATALTVNVGTAGSFVVNGGALGTPSSGTLTNATGLPIGTGVAGLGANVATALTVAVGSAGAPVVNGGALGTPSSGVGTNLTGTAAGLTAGNATKLATARAIGIGGSTGLTATGVNFDGTAAINPALTGTLAVANGGTGDTGTAWSAYTPSPSCGTATFTVNSARSKTMGKITFYELDITIATLGTCTNAIVFSTPNTAQSGGGGAGRETASVGKGVNVSIAGGSAAGILTLSDFSNFAVSERLLASGVYENQ